MKPKARLRLADDLVTQARDGIQPMRSDRHRLETPPENWITRRNADASGLSQTGATGVQPSTAFTSSSQNPWAVFQ